MYHRCQVQVTVSVGSVYLCKLARILLYFLLLDFYRGVWATVLRSFHGRLLRDPDLIHCPVPAVGPSFSTWLWALNCFRISTSGSLLLFDIKTHPVVDFVIQHWIEQQIHLGRGVLVTGILWVACLHPMLSPALKNRVESFKAQFLLRLMCNHAESTQPLFFIHLFAFYSHQQEFSW